MNAQVFVLVLFYCYVGKSCSVLFGKSIDFGESNANIACSHFDKFFFIVIFGCLFQYTTELHEQNHAKLLCVVPIGDSISYHHIENKNAWKTKNL